MHKEKWIYYGHLKQHLVQLAHQVRTGKIIIILNKVVLFEDFITAEEPEKVFNFFVDDELCVVSVTKTADKKFAYKFDAPEFSTSTIGQRRKLMDRLQKFSAVFAISLFLLVGVLPVAYYFYNKHKQEHTIDLGGLSSSAIVSRISKNKNSYTIDGQKISANAWAFYSFKLKNNWFHGKAPLELIAGKTFSKETHLPIAVQDEFEVLYASASPSVSQLQFNKPVPKQVKKYILLIREECLKNENAPAISDSTQRMIYCDCKSVHFKEEYELEGLARLYHQNTLPSGNATYNQDTYQTFMATSESQAILKTCEEAVTN